MAEMMLGMVVVGLVAGIFVGRHTTRSRRSFADRTSARATYEKYQKAVWVDTRRAVITVAIVGFFIIALVVSIMKDTGTP